MNLATEVAIWHQTHIIYWKKISWRFIKKIPIWGTLLSGLESNSPLCWPETFPDNLENVHFTSERYICRDRRSRYANNRSY